MKENKSEFKLILLISTLFLLLVAALFVVSGIPTGNTIDFIFEVPQRSLQAGDQFEATFKITTRDIEEFKLAGFQAEIEFDGTLFEIIKVKDLAGDNTIAQFNTNESTVKYICVNDFTTETEGYKTFGNIFSVTLSAKKDIEDVTKAISSNDFGLLLGDYNSKKISDYTLAIKSVEPQVIKAGDVNGNEKVNTEDAVYLLYNIIYGDAIYPVNQDCDFDNSENVNTDDAIYLLYHVIFGAEKYPLN